MRCDKCVHWGIEESKWAEERGLKVCNRAVMFDFAFCWKDVDGELKNVPEDPSLKMYVQDGSSYYAALYTAPDFFCAHFEGEE